MGGITSIGVGMALLAAAIWAYWYGESAGIALMFGGAAMIFFARGFRGIGVESVEDLTAPIQFISNPADAIVDAAVDRANDLATGARTLVAGDPEPKFDPDAAIARYLENRPPAPQPPPLAPVRQAPVFGRKRA